MSALSARRRCRSARRGWRNLVRCSAPAAATGRGEDQSQVRRDAGRRLMKAALSISRQPPCPRRYAALSSMGIIPSSFEVLAVTESHRRQLIDMVARPEDEVDLARASPPPSPARNIRSSSWIPICSDSTRWRRPCAAASAPPRKRRWPASTASSSRRKASAGTRASTTIRATASSTTCSTAARGSRSPSPRSTSRWDGEPGSRCTAWAARALRGAGRGRRRRRPGRPFNGGTVLTPQDCQDRLDRIYGGRVRMAADMLVPCPPRAVLGRTLRNLKRHLSQGGRPRARAADWRSSSSSSIPAPAEEVRDRGLVLAALECYALAVT